MSSLHSVSWYGLTHLFGRLPYWVILMGIGTYTFVVTLVSTQMTTATPWLLAGCIATPPFWLIYRGEAADGVQVDPLMIASAAFVGWCGITLLWSPAGGEAWASWMRMCLYLAATLVTCAAMHRIDHGARRVIGWAFVAALGVAIVAAVVDGGWNLAVRRFLMSYFGGARSDLGAVVENGWVVHLSTFETNKSISVLFSLLWPGLLIAAALTQHHAWRLIVAAAAIVFAIATVLSDNETVKLALVVSVLAYVVVLWRPAVTAWLLGTGWIACTLGMLPLVLLLSTMRAQDATAIQDSGRHRLVIWNFVSNEVLKHPVAGSGLASTRQPRETDASRAIVDLGPKGKGWVAGTAIQPHNNFLQVWNELGGIGAVLLCLAGLALVRDIAAVRASIRPYYAAAFAGAAILACLQWTINSSWYIAAYALTALFLRFGAVLMEAAEGSEDQRPPTVV